MSAFKSPLFSDVTAAAARLAANGAIHRTPLLESVALNLLTGGRILVKAEALQIAGSFKIRGAMNRVLCLSPEERAKGVVAFSSGNFGQGLAAACMFEKVKCTIVMPGDAPVSKEQRATSYGAKVVRSEIIEGVNREVTASALARSISTNEGATLLHPFEDFHVMAGQGTCALEILEQCEERRAGTIDALLIPTGGGGLSAGCCLAMAERSPGTQLYAVEPQGYDDHSQSLAAGAITPLKASPSSLCDSLQAVAPGEHTFPTNKALLTGGLVVSDAEVAHAMVVAFEMLQLVLEPGGAAGLAAVLAGKVDVKGKTIAVIGSGGNIDLEKFGKIYHSHTAAGQAALEHSPKL